MFELRSHDTINVRLRPRASTFEKKPNTVGENRNDTTIRCFDRAEDERVSHITPRKRDWYKSRVPETADVTSAIPFLLGRAFFVLLGAYYRVSEIFGKTAQ